MLDNIKIKDQQERLFKSCQYVRLSIAHISVERDLKNNMPEFYNQNDGFMRKASVTIGNTVKENNTAKLQRIKAQTDQQFSIFTQKNNTSSLIQNFQELKNAFSEAFREDYYGLGRIMFCASIIFDGEYIYHYDDDGLRHISAAIYDDENTIHYIKNDIQNTYCKLAKQPMTSTQKLLLAGAAALALSTFVVPQLAFANIASGGEILGGLASAGGAVGAAEGMAAITGIGLLGVGELLLDSALVGFAYVAMNQYNKNMVKKSFRNMNYNQMAQMLAIKVVLMNQAQKRMPKNAYKEKLNELLQMIQDLKSDTDYILLVENQDIENNKKKIQVFHNLDKELLEQLINTCSAKLFSECRGTYKEWMSKQGQPET